MDFFGGKTVYHNKIDGDSDTEYDDNGDDIRWNIKLNDAPINDIDEDFRKSVLNAKHELYNGLIFSGKKETHNAHDIVHIKEYLTKINELYNICKQLQLKNTKHIPNLSIFPKNAQNAIHDLCVLIIQTFNKYSIPDIIPYEDYLKKSFHEYPYVQNESFRD